ncbi:MAG TPA: hypothetical protein VJ992_03685 [Gemmatimonadales bacterium]|nr:hypothetical protein [Gemmatimonadales bacterium]
MPRVAFDRLPDDARLWVFTAARTLAPGERDQLLENVDAFLDGWAAHGTPLTCAREIRYDQFLLVAVDEHAAGASGCSIDALTQRLRGLEQRLGVSLLENAPVLYKDGETIRRVPRPEFAALAERGTVTADTIVFDNSVVTVGAVRDGTWETPARASWHGRAYFGVARTGA